MEIMDLIKSRRSIRRFQQKQIDEETLIALVDCGRLAPSGSNLQPLEFVIINNKTQVDNIFNNIKWAAYITPEGDPPEGSRPVGYIVVLVNTEVRSERYEFDIGSAVENIILAALGKGIASCWIANFKPKKISEILELPDKIKPIVVIALGYPAHDSKIEPFKGSVKYWKDENENFHVPKRSLESILHKNRY
jgi:nitroreductase